MCVCVCVCRLAVGLCSPSPWWWGQHRPSLTYLQPTGQTHVLRYGGALFTVVDVEPSFPS